MKASNKTRNGIVLKTFVEGKLKTVTFRNVPSDTMNKANNMIDSEYNLKRKGSFLVGYDWQNKPVWVRGVLCGVLSV